MSKQVQISDELSVNPELVAAVKEISKLRCIVFFSGTPGGLMVDRPAEDVRADIGEPDLHEVAQKLLDALDAAWQPLNDLVTWSYEQGHPYDGPSFFEPTQELRRALGHEVPED